MKEERTKYQCICEYVTLRMIILQLHLHCT
jgi:hypothetical protein